MKALFVTIGPIHWASARMRAYWIAPYMTDATVMLADEYASKTAQGWQTDADAVIFQKRINVQQAEVLRQAGKQVWWDVCDPMWWWEPKASLQAAQAVTGTVASSLPLAQDFTEWRGETARVIPDRLEPAHFTHQRQHTAVDPVRLIWYGMASNRVALHAAVVTLERLCANGIAIELTICDERPDQTVNNNAFPIYTVPWSLAQETAIFAAHDIALLPPYPGAWGAVKSNNKALTARACGLPVSDGLDYRSLRELCLSADLRTARGTLDLDSPAYHVKQSAAEWEQLLCG